MDTSPLLRLPIELRCQIYQTALAQRHVIVYSKPDQFPTPSSRILSLSNSFYIQTPTRYPLALAQTCTQIRHEAMEVFFVANNFGMVIHFEYFAEPASEANLEKYATKSLVPVETTIAEVYGRLCGNGKNGRRSFRLDLEFGGMPIRMLKVNRDDRIVALRLQNLQQLVERYRNTTPLDLRLRISLDFRWRARAIDRGSERRYTKARLPVHVDMDDGYKSLQDILEKCEMELDGFEGIDEEWKNLEEEMRGNNAIKTDGPRPREGYRKAVPELAAQVGRAMDAMKLWQHEFLPKH